MINAEGELQASQMLTQAAGVMAQQPAALQLRYLQTLSEIATENNSTTLFPIPIDLFGPLIEAVSKRKSDTSGSEPAETPSLPRPKIESIGTGEAKKRERDRAFPKPED